MTSTPSRRDFLRYSLGAGVAVVGLPALLAACGSDSSSSSSSDTAAGGGARGKATVRLSYTHGTAFAGTYLADGFYQQEGFDKVELIGGGPSATPPVTDVTVGKALVGLVSTPDQVAAARLNNDQPVKIIGALYQKNPYCVTSLASDPIRTPQDMVGKTIGVQAANETVWNAFLAAAGIDPDSIETVPVQFDPSPLTAKQVQGWFSFITNEPVTLAAAGVDVETMLLADFGYPLVGQCYVATDKSIAERPDDLKAVLAAEVKGWTKSLEEPASGAEIAIDEYASDLGLDLEVQTELSKVQNQLILTDETRANGLMTMTTALIEGNLETLAASGLDISADDLFDLSLLEALYAERPELVGALAGIQV